MVLVVIRGCGLLRFHHHWVVAVRNEVMMLAYCGSHTQWVKQLAKYGAYRMHDAEHLPA